MAGDPQAGSTRSRLLRAGSLTVTGQVASNALRLAGNLVLTRLLAPETFGIMALATVLVIGIFMLSDFGLQQVVVRSPNGEDQNFLDTVWTVQVLHGSGVAALLLASGAALAGAQSAGLIAPHTTYARVELPWVLAGLSLQAILEGCLPTKFPLAMRRMQIGRVVAIEISCQVISLVLIAAWAYVQPSVAALVAGTVSATLCKLLAGNFLLPGVRNRLRMNRPGLDEIRSFGAWIFVASSLSFVIANVDKLVLGASLGPREFGLYAIALTLVMAMHDLVLQISRRVVFPALSSAYRADPQSIGRYYYRLRLPIDAFCLFMAGLLATSGDLLVGVLYDKRYADAGQYFRILAVALLGFRYAVLGELFQVLGRTRLLLYEKVSRLVLLVLGISVGLHTYGILGVACAVALSFLAGPAVSIFFVQRKLGYLDMRRELLPAPFIFLGVGMGLAARALT
jgi:O-antigen/teichoic acid export membrane protein